MEEHEIAVSVLMSVYNENPEYLDVAVKSILNQSLQIFEFIIIDDGCTDDIKNQLEGYQDNRIVLIHNPINYGLTKSLNIGLRVARGKYIARMDSDDCSYPQRLELQFKYMEDHPQISILGSWVRAKEKVLKAGGMCPY